MACRASTSCAAGRLPTPLWSTPSTSSSMTARIDLPFLDRKAALSRLLRNTEVGILFNEHLAEDGQTVFAHACRLGVEGTVSNRVDGASGSGRGGARMQ